MANLFVDQHHADLYTKYRPVYPESVLEAVVGFCQQGGGDFNYALDMGCGSGNVNTYIALNVQKIFSVYNKIYI